MIRKIVFATLAVTMSAAAQASFITYQFDGVLGAYDAHIPDLPSGTAITFVTSFDTEQPDQCGATNRGFYSPSGGSVTYLGVSHAIYNGGLEINNPFGNCGGAGSSSSGSATLRLFIASGLFYNAVIEFSTPTVDTFPLFPSTGLMRLAYLGYNYTAVGPVSNIASIPEPAVFGLFSAGLLGLVIQRRRATTVPRA